MAIRRNNKAVDLGGGRTVWKVVQIAPNGQERRIWPTTTPVHSTTTGIHTTTGAHSTTTGIHTTTGAHSTTTGIHTTTGAHSTTTGIHTTTPPHSTTTFPPTMCFPSISGVSAPSVVWGGNTYIFEGMAYTNGDPVYQFEYNNDTIRYFLGVWMHNNINITGEVTGTTPTGDVTPLKACYNGVDYNALSVFASLTPIVVWYRVSAEDYIIFGGYGEVWTYGDTNTHIEVECGSCGSTTTPPHSTTTGIHTTTTGAHSTTTSTTTTTPAPDTLSLSGGNTDTFKATGVPPQAKTKTVTSSAPWYCVSRDSMIVLGNAIPPTDFRMPTSGTLNSGDNVRYSRGATGTVGELRYVDFYVGGNLVETLTITLTS